MLLGCFQECTKQIIIEGLGCHPKSANVISFFMRTLMLTLSDDEILTHMEGFSFAVYLFLTSLSFLMDQIADDSKLKRITPMLIRTFAYLLPIANMVMSPDLNTTLLMVSLLITSFMGELVGNKLAGIIMETDKEEDKKTLML